MLEWSGLKRFAKQELISHCKLRKIARCWITREVLTSHSTIKLVDGVDVGDDVDVGDGGDDGVHDGDVGDWGKILPW